MAPSLSKEIITDSDSSGHESSSSPEPAPQKTKSSARKPTEKLKPKKQTSKQARKSKPDIESSSSSSDLEVEDESDSSAERGPSTPDMDSAIPKFIPAQEFKAPEGFKLMATTAPRSSDVSKVFSDLRGKQIWHITAPASVPMNSIQELALDAVATGGSILTHSGVDYKLREDQIGAEKNKALLLPDKQGNTYHRNSVNVAQTFHLERIVDLANGATHSEQSVPISALTKPQHEQPRHLKMRYKPFGSTDDKPETFGSSSEESEAEGVSFRMPQTLSQDREGKKRRKSSMEVGSDNEQGERRKKHKRIHSHSADGNAEVHSRNGELNLPPKAKATKNVGIPRGRTEEQHEEKSSKMHRDETSLERRVRKEERKRRKQALPS
ncbi:hypothetical protein EMCG_05374 [[Emmonsia] crescens]|uniref:DNA-directed RNA polymerase I subunit RPA34 n=1 Tax=[Emmonsia] crescens TaxID=73230 RepID=A0A0G2HQA3_9EURO|nr:hypothetical protein EMCG_05374 [Emmonsia crescens UAMH 3008]